MIGKCIIVTIITSGMFRYAVGDENVLMNYVIKHIKDTPKIRLVTLHSEMSEKLSPSSQRFMKKIINEFPTLSLNISELSSGYDNRRLVIVKRWLRTRSQRKSLNIFFIDNDNEENVDKILVDHVMYLIKFTLNTVRPICIFVVNHAKTSLRIRNFFTISWKYKFLNVIVIEMIESSITNQPFLPTITNSTIIFHQYNPFNGVYHKETLLEKLNHHLFIDRLKNMHGYLLETGMFDDIPMVMIERNYPGIEVWGMAQGLDVTITRSLAETLNFTAGVKIVYSDNPNLKRFNITSDFMDRSLETEKIDFVVNFYGMIGSKPLDDVAFEPSIFLYPFSSNLIIRQYGKSKIKLSQNLMIISLITMMIIFAFYTVVRILRLHTKILTIYNIAKVLLGNSIPTDPKKFHERIVFLSLAIISSTLSVKILEQLLNFYLWQNIYPELNTLQDVVNAGIIPSITRSTKRSISSHNHTALQTVLQQSTTIESAEMIADCIEMLINHNKKVNGCEVDSVLGKLVSGSFSDKDRGWIITFVEEPIVQPCWTAMLLTKTSPYANKFNKILRRFSESGFVSFWYQSTLRNFTFIYKNFFGNEELHHGITKYFNNNYLMKRDKTSLNKKIFLIIIIGHALGFLAFSCEIIFGYVQRRISRISLDKFKK